VWSSNWGSCAFLLKHLFFLISQAASPGMFWENWLYWREVCEVNCVTHTLGIQSLFKREAALQLDWFSSASYPGSDRMFWKLCWDKIITAEPYINSDALSRCSAFNVIAMWPASQGRKRINKSDLRSVS
jgi:hypothetical protein